MGYDFDYDLLCERIFIQQKLLYLGRISEIDYFNIIYRIEVEMFLYKLKDSKIIKSNFSNLFLVFLLSLIIDFYLLVYKICLIFKRVDVII